MKHRLVICTGVLFLLLELVEGCTPSPSVLSTPVPGARSTLPQARAALTPSPPANAGPMGSVKGRIVPARYARVASATGGLIDKVLVKEDDRVQAGDTLVELDATDLELQVKAAQDSLDVAKASLAQLRAPATAEEITMAQSVYDTANAALQTALRGPSKEQLVALGANADKAKAQLDQVQAAYDRSGGSSNPYIGMLPVALQLQQAGLDYETAEANYLQSLQPDTASIAQLQGAVAQADANLRAKKLGPKPEEVAVAEARVRQAQTAVEQAQASLANAKMVAPIGGTVAQVTVRQGELLQPGAPVAIVVDLSELHVETTELDQFGVTGVTPNQPVRVLVEPLEDKVLQGKVLYVVPPSLPFQSEISYVAEIALETQDPAVRYGMTVRVEFGNSQAAQ